MPDSVQPTTFAIRDIALARLKAIQLETQSLSVPTPAQESYLFEDNHYVGLRFVAGDLTFEWKLGDANAQIFRGQEQIESISVAQPTSIRKAA